MHIKNLTPHNITQRTTFQRKPNATNVNDSDLVPSIQMSVKPDFVCFCQNMPKFEKDTTCALCYHFENEYKQKKEHCSDKLISFLSVCPFIYCRNENSSTVLINGNFQILYLFHFQNVNSLMVIHLRNVFLVGD